MIIELKCPISGEPIDQNSPRRFLITDAETGGLDDRMNPLLSLSLLAANEKFQAVDNFEMKLQPPVGTLIEVPIPKCQDPEDKRKVISHYMDVHTKAIYRKENRPETALVINAVAAEINGYVDFKDGAWDFKAIDDWHRQARTLADAETTFIKWLLGVFSHPPVGVAHNADFDEKFVFRYMPILHSNYFKPWFCTVKALRAHYKKTGMKGAAKLANLAELANYTPKDAHVAYEDCLSCLAGLRWLTQQHPAA
jgi:hypothetical protein